MPCLYTLLEDTSRLIGRAWAGRKGAVPAAAAITALLLFALPLRGEARSWDSGQDTVHELNAAWQVGNAKRVKITFPVGELEIAAVERPTLSANLAVRADDDASDATIESAKKVRLVATHVGDELRLRVEGWHFRLPGSTVLQGRIEVPRDLALQVDMNCGELEVHGFRQAMRLGLGVGELTVACDPARTASIDVDLGIGEGELIEGGQSRQWAGVFGGGFHWDGRAGGAPVQLKLGVGEASVRLEPADQREAAVAPILRP